MTWVIQHLLVVTFFIVALAIVLVLLIFLGPTRIYGHEQTRSQFGSALVSLLVAVLFSVILNNLYAVRRDRDSRLRNLRDQPYAQLKPVLHTESAKLAEVAQQMQNWAHITRVDQYENIQGEPWAMLWPDVMSGDLRNHFSDYDQSKHTLLSQIEAQDQEFREAVALGEQEIKPTGVDPYWREVDAVSYVEQCVGRGNGVKLRIMESGYSFEYWGASVGGSGPAANPPRPSPDQVAAFRAFRALRPDSALKEHCESLKLRAEVIIRAAQELSKEAQLRSESTILKGACDFLKSASLSD